MGGREGLLSDQTSRYIDRVILGRCRGQIRQRNSRDLAQFNYAKTVTHLTERCAEIGSDFNRLAITAGDQVILCLEKYTRGYCYQFGKSSIP
jgi:hypothetical protein